MSDGEQQPIIVKKIKKGGEGHHGGAWKVAFADFMTAMMAFFLVMWLVGQTPEVRQGVAGFFRDPGKFTKEGKSGVLKGASSVIKAKSSDVGFLAKDQQKSSKASDKEKSELTLAGKKMLKELEKQGAFKRLKKNIKVL